MPVSMMYVQYDRIITTALQSDWGWRVIRGKKLIFPNLQRHEEEKHYLPVYTRSRADCVLEAPAQGRKLINKRLIISDHI